jgi:hypothetical protein
MSTQTTSPISEAVQETSQAMTHEALLREMARRITKYQHERSKPVKAGVFDGIVALIEEHAPELLSEEQ